MCQKWSLELAKRSFQAAKKRFEEKSDSTVGRLHNYSKNFCQFHRTKKINEVILWTRKRVFSTENLKRTKN